MRIGFDISQTGGGKAGCGFFAHAIITGLIKQDAKNLYTLLPSFGDFFFDLGLQTQTSYIAENVVYGPRFISRGSAKEFWNRWNLEDNLQNLDLIHSNNFWCPQNLRRSKLIYTLYDLSFIVNPSWTTESNRIGCFDGIFRASMYADWIIAISEASREHYLKLFPNYSRERIRVVYPCSRFEYGKTIPRKPDALIQVKSEDFILSVGTIEPRKNQLAIAKAYAVYLNNGGKPYPLVFAGGTGWLMEGFEKALYDLNISDKVVLTGYISDEELVWLYKNCLVNIYMSNFEGFGLPVLEGLQHGAPTICSKSTSIPEVAGDGAVLLDFDDEQRLVLEMNDLIVNKTKRTALKEAAQLQASRFQSVESAAKILEIYKEAMATKKAC